MVYLTEQTVLKFMILFLGLVSASIPSMHYKVLLSYLFSIPFKFIILHFYAYKIIKISLYKERPLGIDISFNYMMNS